MSRPAPTSRFRDRISGPLIRILGLHVALVTGFVMALTVAAIYLYQSSRLDYVRERVLTRVVAEVTNQASELYALATSPLLWTGLTDSKGREVYLAPLMERFNRGPLRQLYVLDYVGRVFIAPQSQPATVAAAIAADPIVTASVTALREGFGLRTTENGGTQILLVRPIQNPAAESAVGFIVAAINVPPLLSQLGIGQDFAISLALGEQPLSPTPQDAKMFTTEGSAVAATAELDMPVRIWVGHPVQASVVFTVCGVLVTLMLGMLMIHRVKAWVERFATTITQRLDRLLLECQKVLAGERLEAIEPAPDDELSQVTQALNVMMVQQKKFTDDLRTTSLVFSMAAEGILVTDPKGRIVRANDALLAMTGYGRDELVGQRAGTLYRDERTEELRSTVATALRERGRWSGETTFISRDKRPIQATVAVSRILADDGEVLGNVAVITDIARLKKIENQLRDRANQDALTGLMNFRHMTEQVRQLLDEAQADGRRMAVLFLDLDNFKALNDEYGHAVGDTLIKAMAAHLARHLPAGHLLCRRSGDEFMAVVVRDSTDDHALGRRLSRLVPLQVPTEAGPLTVTATIGVSRFPEDATQWHELQLCADVAMNEAKQGKRGGLGWYTADIGRRLYRRRQLQGRLREAIRTEAFEVHYQPELDLLDGRVVGLEALARWNDAELGEVSPDEFIPVAEEMRVIDLLTLCIADRVLHDKPLLQARFPGAVVAFNASPQVFHRSRLLEFLAERSMRDEGLLAGLEIELTESEVSRIDPSVQLQVQALVGMGIRLVIDDFGTGYSSLSRLTQFPISRIKVDRSFVQGLNRPREMRIARLVIDLAKVLGFEVTAEGVETHEQRENLLALGCRRGQGWLFSQALPASELVGERFPVKFPVVPRLARIP
jgi:diguanylate cyclase (GGDEF)-like protein/PAS domain S-box-containing protein